MLAGKSSQNEEKCLEDQLADAKVAVGNAEIELKQLKTQISHGEKEFKEKKAQFMSKRDEATAVENELNARKNEVETVKKALDSLSFKEDHNRHMETLHQVCLHCFYALDNMLDTITILPHSVDTPKLDVTNF